MTNPVMKRTVVLALIPLAFLFLALPAMSSDGTPMQGPAASCGIIATASGPLTVTEEKPKVVSFSFMVTGRVSKVRFLISKRDKAKGITLLEETAKVKDGTATSRLSFNILDGMPLGRHDLVIEVLAADGGAKICSGKIPYIILPAGAACMCRETQGGNSLNEGLIHTKNTGRYKNA